MGKNVLFKMLNKQNCIGFHASVVFMDVFGWLMCPYNNIFHMQGGIAMHNVYLSTLKKHLINAWTR